MLCCNYRGDLFEKIRDENIVGVGMVPYFKYYRETPVFKEAVLDFVFSICELNPTDKVGSIIHEFLKSWFFKKPEHRRGVYKHIRYVVLSMLWKNHRTIERQKQKKLTFLANELHGVGRTTEAHVVRTIVKPYIRDLNRHWSKMTAFDKLKKHYEKSTV